MAEDTPRAVRVALVNDYEVVVKGLRDMLADFAERVQVVELDLGAEVEQPVDVALYDCFAAQPLHTDDLADLVDQSRVGAVAVYTWETREDLLGRALETGARGWLAKSLDAESLVSAVERLAAGERGRPPRRRHRRAPRAPQSVGDWPGRAAGLPPARPRSSASSRKA